MDVGSIVIQSSSGKGVVGGSDQMNLYVLIYCILHYLLLKDSKFHEISVMHIFNIDTYSNILWSFNV